MLSISSLFFCCFIKKLYVVVVNVERERRPVVRIVLLRALVHRHVRVILVVSPDRLVADHTNLIESERKSQGNYREKVRKGILNPRFTSRR